MTLFPSSSATLSPCGRYRYTLARTWGEAPPLVFVMLNPSTADADKDDPTIRRCMGFARREKAGGIVAVNLFAWRATEPGELWTVGDPVGPDNNDWIVRSVAGRDVVVAWGASLHRERKRSVMAWLFEAKSVRCLGTTKDGSPRHPLYVHRDAPLIEFKGAK